MEDNKEKMEGSKTIAQHIGVNQTSDEIDGLDDLEDTQEVQKSDGGILEKLKAKSPNKDLSDYKSHPLNVDKSEETGQVLRGSEGLLGELNYAILDLIIGIFRLIYKYFYKQKQEEKQKEQEDYENKVMDSEDIIKTDKVMNDE